ncbi:aldehyde dehydrogenase [Bacillus sp. M6-12]|uniref:aldehyde dehydrogenase family protein n=1 Tax=Bacillus sp. M6-12 TaxID=2054166 RepID=UPI000C76A9C1|nr:aldehyde dehydrogenase family protein [Bacillus sp. M6-12]PLS18576.1 aldehyde dehydrogenase [Bacillus sp. M6-12]
MDIVQERLTINGKQIGSNKNVLIYNPANIAQVVGEISVGSEIHVHEAVESASKAWQQWAEIPASERALYLTRTAQYIEKNCEALARLLVMEHGKVLRDAKHDLLGAANVLRYYSSLVHELDDRVIETSQGKMILARQPIGVVSIIVPWNYPIILAFLMLAPALLAGNTVVLKPSMSCPLTLTKILNEVSGYLPEGVLNIVAGSGASVGDAMVTHPMIRKVSFTGSTEVGRSILKGAADTIKNVSMELGGNDAAIILRDAVVNEHLIDEFIKGVFTASGQICYGIKRIYVCKEHYDSFVEKFTQAANKIVVGFGLDPETTMGPLNNKSQFDTVKNLIDNSKASGATVQTVGRIADNVSFEDGYYILPTIITNVSHEAEIVKEEQFGPVIPIIPFETEEDAIRMANDSEFGLGNSIWTADVDRGFKLGRKLQSGSVFVNIHRVGASAANMPFGGFKQSGIGRGHGVEGLYENTELQAIIHRTDM